MGPPAPLLSDTFLFPAYNNSNSPRRSFAGWLFKVCLFAKPGSACSPPCFERIIVYSLSPYGEAMSPKLRRFLIGFVIVLVLIAVIGGMLGNVALTSSLPPTHGEVKINSLKGPVATYRDKKGVLQDDIPRA